MEISCDSRHLHESNFLRYLHFKEKNMKHELMNGTPPGSIHACHPSGWIQSEIFTQWSLHFIKICKADKRKSCYLSTVQALFTHKEPGDHYFILQQPQNVTLRYNFNGALKTFYCQKLKNGSVQTQGESSPSTKFANFSEIHESELQQAK